MTAHWVFVVGPSGAGKDSVINSARQLLEQKKDIIFARRLVTRPSQAGSEHDPITDQDFQWLMASGGLSWHWQAHGFFYGIPAHYSAAVKTGQLVVVNGSRAHLSGLAGADQVKVVEVSASKNQLASRLQQRGRDDPQAIAGRLARNATLGQIEADCVINNDGDLSASGRRLADYLLATLQPITQ